jgi:hypothetical protein
VWIWSKLVGYVGERLGKFRSGNRRGHFPGQSDCHGNPAKCPTVTTLNTAMDVYQLMCKYCQHIRWLVHDWVDAYLIRAICADAWVKRLP